MPIKKTINEVIDMVEHRGYSIIDVDNFKYENKKIKFSIIDKEGYKYTINYDSLNVGDTPNRFSKYNPYTIYNIKLWLKINGYKNELISSI